MGSTEVQDQGAFNDDRKENYINCLDHYSLLEIFMRLPIPERMTLKEVCPKWKETCQHAWYDIKKYQCKSSIGRSYNNRLLTQSYLEKILLMCGFFLKELSLSNVCDSSIMPIVAHQCTNLTKIECEFDELVLIGNTNRFVQAFIQLGKLKTIKIRINYINGDNTIDLYEIIDSFPEEINEIHLISKNESYRNKKFFFTLQKFKNLQRLTVHGHCSDNTIQEIAEKTTLVYLDIKLIRLPVDIFLFDGLINVEHINLSTGIFDHMHNLTTDVLNTIFNTCKNLKYLNIPNGSYEIAEISLENWVNFQYLEHFSMSCDTISDDLAIKIVKYCKNLKELRIGVIDQTTSETALKKLTELKNLENLSLLGHITCSDDVIIVISKNSKKLKRLELPIFSSTYVLEELSKLQYLEHLNLNNVTNIKDSIIIAIANNCKNLKCLKIPFASDITEAAFIALTSMENLLELNVSNCVNITDNVIIELKGLKKLCCAGCKKLSDAGIIQLIKNNPDLDDLDISDINNITADVVNCADKITKNRTNSIILHIRTCDWKLIKATQSIESQWLVFDFY